MSLGSGRVSLFFVKLPSPPKLKQATKFVSVIENIKARPSAGLLVSALRRATIEVAIHVIAHWLR